MSRSNHSERLSQLRRALPGAWVTQAECPKHPDVDFNGMHTLAPKRICRRCPVRSECLRHALDNHEPFGVWGGKTYDERQKILKQGATTT